MATTTITGNLAHSGDIQAAITSRGLEIGAPIMPSRHFCVCSCQMPAVASGSSLFFSERLTTGSCSSSSSNFSRVKRFRYAGARSENVATGMETDEQQQQQQRGNNGSSFKLEPTRKQQQKKRSQWSKGAAPGEYGGPSIDTRIRTSWGGNSTVDPLTSSGDYIWKKKWQSFVETPPSDAADAASLVAPIEKQSDSGFLSLNRAISLDSMDVDLSAELMKPSKATLQRQVEEALRFDPAADQKRRSEKPRWRSAPTRREEELWARSRKAATGGSEVMARDVKRAQVDLRAEAERQRQWYAELKRNLQILTLAIGGLGTTCAYLTYSPEVAGSYGAGLIGALAYIRMLGNSVDGLGTGTTAGAARQALGSPRLMVPVLLVMVYNRWNSLVVPEYGLMHLDLIPMLLGFFTYKAATLVETFKELLPAKEEKDTSV